ncbi:MAG: hypothetical protein HS104_03200 [Polyangiaceae bacterium]|nr:hypothetical protein [Polyangiaceae bacterium]
MKVRASTDPDGETGESVMDRERRRYVPGGTATSGTSSGLIETCGNA